MDNALLQKAVVAFIVVLWVISEFRTRAKKQHADPAIAAADARERHAWRYVRWGYRALQIAIMAYLFKSLIQYLLA